MALKKLAYTREIKKAQEQCPELFIDGRCSKKTFWGSAALLRLGLKVRVYIGPSMPVAAMPRPGHKQQQMQFIAWMGSRFAVLMAFNPIRTAVHRL